MGRKVYPDEDNEEIKVPSFMQQTRYCRDVPFLILFMVFWFGNYCGYVTYDSNGTITAFGNQTTNPYLYYFNLFSPATTSAICVSACPNSTEILSYSNALCVYNTTATAQNFYSEVSTGLCVSYTIESSPILNRCIPAIAAAAASTIVNSTSANTTISANTTSTTSVSNILSEGRDATMQIIADLTITWPVIAIGAGVSLVICLIWMLLLQKIAAFFVWLTIIACNLVFDVGAIWLYLYWQTRLAEDSGGSTSGVVAYASAYVGINNSTAGIQIETQTVANVFYVMCAIAGLLLLITLALIKRIVIAIRVIKQASKAMSSMPTIIIFPLFIWILMIANLVYFIYIMLYIITPSGQVTPSIELFSLVWTDSNISQYELGYHIFGFLWTLFFFSGINQVTIAGAIATWYWTMDKKKSLKLPVLRSLGRTLLYHLGSIAVGSLLIAIVEFIRILLYEVQRRIKKTQNQFLIYLVACLQCCMKVVSMLVKFINRNAYIYLAITGKAFFKSAGEATALIVKNALRTVAVDFVSDFVLFISKLFVTGIAAFLAYLYLTYWSSALPNASSINYPFVTVVFVGIAAFIVGTAFFSIYDMAINTIFLSFLMDIDKNDGSRERPYYMADDLKKVLGIENEEPKKKEKGTAPKKVKHTQHIDEL
ncbi:hypothetical protein HDV01_005876 [Terramyces sp. JEL0728]|nr:hypothetical protein HDV01_005876 [Terramyces sp. JEL0728]